MERLTLRAEAGSWPLWDDEEGDAVDPDALDLSPELMADLDAWTLRLEQVDGWFEDEDERTRFDEQGRELWERMADELKGRVALSWRASFGEDGEDAVTD